MRKDSGSGRPPARQRLGLSLALLSAIAGCGVFTDAATRIAYDFEA